MATVAPKLPLFEKIIPNNIADTCVLSALMKNPYKTVVDFFYPQIYFFYISQFS